MGDEFSWSILILYIWVILLTIFVVGFGVAALIHKVNFGPTGPTGSPGQFGGPTGPTGPTGNINPSPGPSPGPITGVASSWPASFYTPNGTVTDYQVIAPGIPQQVSWVLTTNTLTNMYNLGTFTLAPGTYTVSPPTSTTSIVYPSTNHSGMPNSGGSTRSAAIWLRSGGNTVFQEDIIAPVQVLAMTGTTTTLSFPINTQFTVTNKHQFSIITWHDSPTSLEIGGLSRFTLVKIA